MCWRKQTIYKDCRHSRIEELTCDDEKRRRRAQAHPAASSASTTRSSRREQDRSPWLALFCSCFFLAPAAAAAAPPREEGCRLKPTLASLNGKCPRCLEEEANAAVFSGPGVVQQDPPPFRPDDAVAEASRRHGFIGDKHLHAAGRPVSHGAYGGTGPQRDPRQGRSGPSSAGSRREGTDPAEAQWARRPLYTNVRYEEALRRQRQTRREQHDAQGHEHYSQHTQTTPAYRSSNQGQDQGQEDPGPSGPTAGLGGNVDDQPFHPRASTAHLAPRPLQRSRARADQEVAGRARANGRSTARARRSPPLSVVLEDRSSWGAQGGAAASPPESSPELSLDELIEEVEELWRTAPNQRR
ncbi:hypothetical protein LZ30DRAFT_274811 [Colletotrichum cereale]|nr:hypothetical protein LZ30DRAFT_274811 [Colletotrichum cereale]